ncbi:ABC transporter permease [Pleionea litopenaei]|uniref:Transport permease protein n=1 Tax=Pleionea litopenaei TaxID=3070815 RepID=A0AA51X7C6_9GAMM|nr:ABC transporter permease [Pleionea sp. HL-JVS1]WMS88073.1 ABC transporter permease [Pleionea sp. HL-JVS1]
MINTFNAIRALIKKELLTLFKEPANRIILFVPALLQSLLFGYGATYDLTNVPYAVLDQSKSETSQSIISHISGTGVFHLTHQLSSTTEIAEVIENEQAILVMVFQSDFEQKLARQQPTSIQMLLDGRNSTTAGLASAYIQAIIGKVNQSFGTKENQIQLITRAWYNPNLESRWNIMPGLIAMLSMIQTLLIAALSVAREREQGTFDQLLVTPLTPIQILIGKAVPAITIGLIQSSVVLLIIRFWFNIPMAGSLLDLYLGLLIFTIAVVGVGLSISAISLSMQQAMLYTFLIIMPMTLLSGLLTPVKNMPDVLQTATYANPLRFGLDISRRVYLEGTAITELTSSIWPLLIMAAVTIPLASWMFRHRLS